MLRAEKRRKLRGIRDHRPSKLEQAELRAGPVHLCHDLANCRAPLGIGGMPWAWTVRDDEHLRRPLLAEHRKRMLGMVRAVENDVGDGILDHGVTGPARRPIELASEKRICFFARHLA